MPSEQQLETPLMRTDIDWRNYNDPNLIVVPSHKIKDLEQEIPSDVLLNATRELEHLEKGRREKDGFASAHCGSNTDMNGVIEEGSFGHVLEHAIVAVLDHHLPTNEICAGGITSNSHTTDPELGTLSDIRIAYPTSMTQSRAEQCLDIIMQAVKKQYQTTHSINLSSISL